MASIRSTCLSVAAVVTLAGSALCARRHRRRRRRRRLPAFEVASVKPSNPDPSNPLSMVPMAMPQPGGRFVASNIPLRLLIRLAYEVQDFQISGGPAWMLSNKFDITAKAAGGATLGQKELMPLVRALLTDRFKLKTHTETREMPVYDLVIARDDRPARS